MRWEVENLPSGKCNGKITHSWCISCGETAPALLNHGCCDGYHDDDVDDDDGGGGGGGDDDDDDDDDDDGDGDGDDDNDDDIHTHMCFFVESLLINCI